MNATATKAPFEISAYLARTREEKRIRDLEIETAIAALGNARAVRLACSRGYGDKVVSPSLHEPGRWQLTTFCNDGMPFGHVTFDTRDLCVRTAMGQWLDEIPGPPYGDRFMTIAEVLR